MSNYKRPFSVNYRKPVVMDSSDPRYQNLERYRSRLGRKVIVKDLPEPMQIISPVEKFMNIYANIETEGTAFVVDSQNNIYLLSLDYREPDYYTMFFLTKIDKNGNFVWEIRIDDLEDEGAEFNVVGLDIDSNNNIYISLSFDVTPVELLYIVKINSEGSLIWNKFIGNSNYDMNNSFQGGVYKSAQCKIDSDLNLYVIANIARKQNPNLGDIHHLIMKLDSSGNIIWQNVYADSSLGNTNNYFCNGLDVDSSNNLYTISADDESLSVLTKYDTSGNIIFIKQINNLENNYLFPSDIVIDNNNIYIACFKDLSGVAGGELRLLKLDTSANIIWERNIGYQPFFNSYYQSTISSVQNNSIFIIMPYYEGGTNTYFVIVKMDTDGNYLSQKKITKPLNIVPTNPGDNAQTAGFYINQTNTNLYCSGSIHVGFTVVSFIFKISNLLSEEHAISFANAIVYDDDYPPNPYSISKSFNINIEDTSLLSPTTSSSFSLSNYIYLNTITDSIFTTYSGNILFNKTTSPDLIQSKGVFA